MLSVVAQEYRTDWGSFEIADTFDTKFLINTGIIEASDLLIGMLLNFVEWHGAKYTSDNTTTIGYGIGDINTLNGYTEAESYSLLYSHIRDTEKRIKGSLPVVSMPQSVFDALLSLYLDTGTWRFVRAPEGTYDVASAIKNSNWILAADMISRGKINPSRRMQEARIMILAEYGRLSSRVEKRALGIQELRTRYMSGVTDNVIKRQIEYSYYKQVGSPIPKMSPIKVRRMLVDLNK